VGGWTSKPARQARLQEQPAREKAASGLFYFPSVFGSGLVLNNTPFGTNSRPASSNAFIKKLSVLSRKDSPLSNRATVSGDTFAACARSRTPHPNAARAILHWIGENRNTATISLAGALAG
jgi:hypothetical protein